jgi:hypothetical protein
VESNARGWCANRNLRATVLAWLGPSIVVATTFFGVYLLTSGITELFLSFTFARVGGGAGLDVHHRRVVGSERVTA